MIKSVEYHPNRKDETHVFFAFGTLYPHLTGGMEVFNYHFIRYFLSQKKQDVLYFSDHPIKGWEKCHINYTNLRPFTFLYPIQFIWTVIKLRAKINYTVLSFSEQSWVIPFLQSAILRILKKPYYVVIHWGHLPKTRFDWPIRVFFRNAVSVIAVSKQIEKDYRAFLGTTNFKYIPPLIPFEKPNQSKEMLRQNWGFPLDAKIILFVGSLKTMKNPDDLIEAALIQGVDFLKKHNVHYVLAGDGHLKVSLEESSRNGGIGDHVHLTGLVDRSRIPELYMMADLYVIASDYEGTPLSLLEAMYHSLPIVASAVPGIRDLIFNGQNGVLYTRKKSDELSHSILQLLNDPLSAIAMGKMAKETYASQFSYEKMIAAYEQVFGQSTSKAKVRSISDLKTGKIIKLKKTK